MKKLKFNKGIITVDVVIWTIASLIVWFYRIVSGKIIIYEYIGLMMLMMLAWIVISCFTGRYTQNIMRTPFRKRILSLLIVTCFFAAISTYYAIRYTSNLAGDIFFWSTVNVGIMALIVEFVCYAYKYAEDLEGESKFVPNRKGGETVVAPREKLTEKDYGNLKSLISSKIGEEGLKLLGENVDLTMSTTKCLFVKDLFDAQSLREYRFDTIVNLSSLNTIRGINKLFCTINSKLPDNGKFVCFFTPQEVIKAEILSRFPKIINYAVYSAYFIYRRVLPRLFFSRRLYFDITKGKKRVFSKTEILGRLYFCGFAVEKELMIGRQYCIIVRRKKQPEPQSPRKYYGIMIRLPRIGKDYQTVYVYKMRTMHPYAEYIQQYVYEKKGLQEGGKFANDERVTTLGKWMRKYWIDELPMILNVLKGDMKWIGVRPLSRQYFSLYPEELQLLRTRYKSGLIPPFYVDMPKTKEEIFESERKYLQQYGKNPKRTDVRYLFMIMRNILLKRARSH